MKAETLIRVAGMACFALGVGSTIVGMGPDDHLNRQLKRVLDANSFTGSMQFQLNRRLRRHIDTKMADLGRLLWFDKFTGLHDDNSCGGCHSPTAAFGDTQSIAIGIDNNNIVGPGRSGPRNQRRTPMAVNTAFYPRLMWNGRFSSNTGDPFNNSTGFTFPAPEGSSLSGQSHLLRAQAFIPPTERTEAAGFEFPGKSQDIRDEVVRRLNSNAEYKKLFAEVFKDVRRGGPLTYDMFAAAIAEFEFTQVYANAPIDEFARGDRRAMSEPMKRGALLFFGKAACVSCHSTKGQSNEMFSDFQNHVAAIPQIVPTTANVVYDGPGQNEDFGFEQVTGLTPDRYKFRTSPLRNVGLQPAFFHNGAFTDLKSAIRYHIDPKRQLPTFDVTKLAADLRNPLAPMGNALSRLEPRLDGKVKLSESELSDLTSFVGEGLTDRNARPKELIRFIPKFLPSGRTPMVFQFDRHR